MGVVGYGIFEQVICRYPCNCERQLEQGSTASAAAISIQTILRREGHGMLHRDKTESQPGAIWWV